MDDTTMPVVEENNLPAPTDETTLTEQPSNEEVEQPEQAIDDSSQAVDEPLESPTEPEEQRDVKRIPRIERRFDQFTKKLAEVSRAAQPSAAQYLPTNEMPRIEPGMEYDAEQLDQVLTQKAQAISAANTTQLVAQLQAQQTVQSYVNQISEDMAELRSLSPLLDPNKPDTYDPDLEAAIAEEFEGRNPIEVNGQYNPRVDLNLRLKDVAKKHLANVERYRTKGQLESKQDLQAAADSAVIPPNGDITAGTDEDSMEALRNKLADFKF